MYIRNDEILEAVKRGRIAAVFSDSRLRAYSGLSDHCSVYGFTSAVITRCGAGGSLPDALRDIMEKLLTAMITYKGPPTSFRVVVEGARRVYDTSATIPNWVYVRERGGAKAVADAVGLGLVTDISWKRPSLQMLGFDLDTGVVFYEYQGESRLA
ncbi:hypothetical protein [Burkholderia sp. Ac-20365]|uniref:hypothetical protein n=1 Tax=Burkholderia sp. Ac-20365 TaxID=2703897 RepID=UPI00197C3577|nr:hypothetical protein [Burkholderia sp. Ac-20365]MBN3760913.1 hypothetical protein [Burkholderia sp. Ac-20365]